MTDNLAPIQASFPNICPITAAVNQLANSGGTEERGAIFTRREVVEFILDLCSYNAKQPLYRRRLLEPSFGNGDFLLPAIDRLLAAWKAVRHVADPLETLGNCIRAVELHRDTFHRTYSNVVERLIEPRRVDRLLAGHLAGVEPEVERSADTLLRRSRNREESDDCDRDGENESDAAHGPRCSPEARGLSTST